MCIAYAYCNAKYNMHSLYRFFYEYAFKEGGEYEE